METEQSKTGTTTTTETPEWWAAWIGDTINKLSDDDIKAISGQAAPVNMRRMLDQHFTQALAASFPGKTFELGVKAYSG